MATDPDGEVLVHLGSSNYLQRYKIYVTHVQQWRQQFDKLESVDLRYDRQIIVNPDLQGPMKQPPLSADGRQESHGGRRKAGRVDHYDISIRSPAIANADRDTSWDTVAKPTPSRPRRPAQKASRPYIAKPTSVRPGSGAKPEQKLSCVPLLAAKNSGATTKPVPKSVAAVKAVGKETEPCNCQGDETQ